MRLIEQTPLSGASLPVAALKEHLRLGSGFADDAFQDGLLEAQLRAALAAVEARTGKALLTRRFHLRLEDWHRRERQPLPLAPVSAVISVSLADGLGGLTVVDAARYRLVPDTHRPCLEASGTSLPSVATLGWIEIVFDAGFGAAWADVPPDLAQAVLLLAAHFYEHRHETGLAQGQLPFAVGSLIDRWRVVRLVGGGAA